MPNNYSYRKQISSCLGSEWRKIELSRDRKKLLELGKLNLEYGGFTGEYVLPKLNKLYT